MASLFSFTCYMHIFRLCIKANLKDIQFTITYNEEKQPILEIEKLLAINIYFS